MLCGRYLVSISAIKSPVPSIALIVGLKKKSLVESMENKHELVYEVGNGLSVVLSMKLVLELD